jgi:AcrR family transcriptional regulator
MNRFQLLVDHSAVRKLLAAAVERFYEHGYAGSSVEQIATDAGLTRADFYAHFASKLALLTEIAQITYGEGVAEVEATVAQSGDDPLKRLDAAVWSECDFAIRYRHALQVIDAGLLLLPRSEREAVLAAKSRLTEIISEVVADGALSGVFAVDRPAATSRALAGMCASLGSTYVDGGTQSARATAETYCELAMRMTGATTVAPSRRHLVAVPELLSA